MIIGDDKKKIATIISSRKTARGESLGSAPMQPEIVKTEDGEIDGRHVAAQDIMSALHEKSPEKLMRALGNFHDLHGNYKAPDSKEE